MEMQVSAHQRPILPPLVTSHPSSYQRLSPQSFSSQPRIPSPPNRQQQLVPGSLNPPAKRPRPNSPPTQPSPAKRQSKWTPEEDVIIIELRGSGMKWEDISKRLPGRSAISCRLHYQNYLERRSEWDEEKKNRLARLYERLKPEMWGPLAAELSIPWRAAEAMHWQLGEADMARRAGVVPFSLAANTQSGPMPNQPPPGVPPPSLGQYHHAPSGPGTPNPGYGPTVAGYPPLTDQGPMRPRGSSVGSREDAVNPPILPAVSLSGIPPSAQSQGLLPSMAEFERGLTSSSEIRGIPPPQR